MVTTIAMSGSRAAAGAALLRIIRHPSVLIVLVFFLVLYGWEAVMDGRALPFGVVVALIGGTAMTFHHFLRHMIVGAEHALLPSAVADVDALAFSLLRHESSASQVTLASLFDAALKTEDARFLLEEMQVDVETFRTKVLPSIAENAANLGEILAAARAMLPSIPRTRITGGVFILALFSLGGVWDDILNECDLSFADLQHILRYTDLHDAVSFRPTILSPRWIRRNFGSIGRTWVMGYTSELDRMTVDLTAAETGRKTVLHQDKLATVLRLLRESSLHNVLLVGQRGVGKETLIENLAGVLRHEEHRMLEIDTRVLILRSEILLSGTSQADQFLLRAIERASHAGKFLLVIPDLPMLLRASSESLRVVLLRMFQEKNIHVVAVTSAEEYHRSIRSMPAVDSLFERVTLEEPAPEDLFTVVLEHAFRRLEQTHVRIPYRMLRDTIALSTRYVGGVVQPGKAIAVLNDAVDLARRSDTDVLKEEHIRQVISEKVHMNVQKVTRDERELLLSLESALQERIIGQDEAVRVLVQALKRARTDIADTGRPIGTFLFLGPTGVGKTHTARVVAQEYFGAEEALIRLDMNEFSTEASIVGIIGSATDPNQSYLTRRVQDRPFSLVLLDEIEKAHPKVLNLFLQALDEGMLTDSRGIRTNFRNCVIVATSNAGALYIRDIVTKNPDIDPASFKRGLVDHLLASRIFSPEFLNRFDATIVYRPLVFAHAERIAALLIAGIARKLLSDRGIALIVDPFLLQAVVERGFSAEFGARELRRAVVEIIENALADILLTRDCKRGESIVLKKEDVLKE